MTWKIRHDGSPRSIDGLSSVQVLEGLQDGQWETTDEVMGAEDQDWVAIENHPQFAELAADIEPPPPHHREDETRLDMNPLIDVCLVLLIFFIITASYAALQKILDMPDISARDETGIPKMTPQQVAQLTIKVEARQENGKPVIRVEDKVTQRENLTRVLSTFVKSKRVTKLLLDASGDVDWGTIVAIQDAAKGAGITAVNFLVQKSDVKASQ